MDLRNSAIHFVYGHFENQYVFHVNRDVRVMLELTILRVVIHDCVSRGEKMVDRIIRDFAVGPYDYVWQARCLRRMLELLMGNSRLIWSRPQSSS